MGELKFCRAIGCYNSLPPRTPGIVERIPRLPVASGNASFARVCEPKAFPHIWTILKP
jgi:hypothetical protein